MTTIRHLQRSCPSTFRTVILLLLAVVASWSAAAAEPSARKPNFIFILTDDMSWGDVGCFGHPYAKPNADVEIGQRSLTLTHLACIGYRLNRPLRWDPAREDFINDPEARRYLDTALRAPWHM